jgi:hypothetical protein
MRPLFLLIVLGACGEDLVEKANELSGLDDCEEVAACGDLVYVDCNSAVDGPAFYFNRVSSQLISKCGGWTPRDEACPPPAWDCAP